MKKILMIAMLFIFSGLVAQTNTSGVEQQIQLLTWEAEKIMSEKLNSSLKVLVGNTTFSLRIKLMVSQEKIKSRQIPVRTSTRYSDLPGLDSVSNLPAEKNPNSTLVVQDILSSLEKANVVIGTTQEWSQDLKSEVETFIREDLLRIGVNDFSVDFKVNATQNSLPPSPIDIQRSELPKNITYIIAGSIISAGLLLSFILYWMLSLGIKKMEGMGQNLVREMALSSNQAGGSTTSAPQSSPVVQTKSSYDANKQLDSYEDVKEKIQAFILNHKDLEDEIRKFIFAGANVEYLFILLESLPEQLRKDWKAQLPDALQVELKSFLSKFSSDSNEVEDLLQTKAHQLLKDLRLFLHDPDLLRTQTLKTKVNKLDRLSLAHLIEGCDEREFGSFIQLIDPVTLSSVLHSYSHLLKKFNKIPKVKLTKGDLSVLQGKVDNLLKEQESSVVEDVSLANFLPPELEQELNEKMGISNSSWDKLTHEQKVQILPFALSLSIDQLSSFLAVLPLNLKEEIMGKLPDIKAQQISRRGVKLNEDSFRLKNMFLVQNKGSQLSQ